MNGERRSAFMNFQLSIFYFRINNEPRLKKIKRRGEKRKAIWVILAKARGVPRPSRGKAVARVMKEAKPVGLPFDCSW